MMTRLICIIAALLALALVPKPSLAATAAQTCYQDYSNGNYTAAIKDCTVAIGQNANDNGSYVNRCAAYNVLGNYSAALADCNQAIALNPKLVSAYDYRGLAYEKQGQNPAANADYQKVLAIDPSNQFAQEALKRLGASPTAPGGR